MWCLQGNHGKGRASRCCAGELASLLEQSEAALVERMLPHALPPLVEAGNKAALEALAEKAGSDSASLLHNHCHTIIAKCLYEGVTLRDPPNSPKHLACMAAMRMFLRSGVHARMHSRSSLRAALCKISMISAALCQLESLLRVSAPIKSAGICTASKVLAGADDFDAFVNFVETTVGKGFISLLDSLMQKIIIDILHRASDSGGWAGGYTLPDTVLQTATHALVNLSDIQNRSSAADFLARMSPSTHIAH